MPDPLVLTLWPWDTTASRNAMKDPMLEEFAASVATSERSLAAAPTTAQLEGEAPVMLSCGCTSGLLGRQQTVSQHADLVLQTPPPRRAQLSG